MVQIVKEQQTLYHVESKGAGSAVLVMQIVKEQRTELYGVQ